MSQYDRITKKVIEEYMKALQGRGEIVFNVEEHSGGLNVSPAYRFVLQDWLCGIDGKLYSVKDCNVSTRPDSTYIDISSSYTTELGGLDMSIYEVDSRHQPTRLIANLSRFMWPDKNKKWTTVYSTPTESSSYFASDDKKDTNYLEDRVNIEDMEAMLNLIASKVRFQRGKPKIIDKYNGWHIENSEDPWNSLKKTTTTGKEPYYVAGVLDRVGTEDPFKKRSEKIRE